MIRMNEEALARLRAEKRLEIIPGAGHLFTDRSLPAEYDQASSELLWQRVEEFIQLLP